MPFKIIQKHENVNGGTLFEMEHETMGTKWFHLATDNPEKVFMVCFPTMPTDDTGVAHILEHMSLCGSKKFPVRDPFFNMVRRSLATFLNAMTYPDRTIYPFSTVSEKDFFNLLSVYLDAAYFPNLDENDFMQEGWRLEPSDPKDDNSPLAIKGIVYNEMKGAMSSPLSILWMGTHRHLFDGCTYSHEYGGDPKSIPNLSHAEVKAFHHKHYHPSNSIIMTTGDMEIEKVMEFVENEAISKFEERLCMQRPSMVEGKQTTAVINIPSAGNPEEEWQWLRAWRLGSGLSSFEIMKAKYLLNLLVGDSTAPLRNAMENAGFGTPGNIICMDTDCAEPTFWLGMSALREDEIEQARQLVVSTLQEIVKTGFSPEREKTVLLDFEIASRTKESGRMPYGMTTMLHAMDAAVYGRDVVAAIESEKHFNELVKFVEQGNAGQQILEWLMGMDTFIDVVGKPDSEWAERQLEVERDITNTLVSKLSPQQKLDIVAKAKELHARQDEAQNVDVLPTLKQDDIPREASDSQPIQTTRMENGVCVQGVACDTNELVYIENCVEFMPTQMTDEDILWLDLGAHLFDAVGVGEMDYAETIAWRAENVPNISAHIAFRTRQDTCVAMAEFSAKTVERFGTEAVDVLKKCIHEVRFDEVERLRYLIADMRQSVEMSIMQNGLHFAVKQANSLSSEANRLRNLTTGKDALFFIRKVAEESETDEGIAKICDKLKRIWQRHVINNKSKTYVIGNFELFKNKASELTVPLKYDFVPTRNRTGNNENLALVSKTPVAYCCMAYKAPSIGTEDAPLLALAGSAMMNGYLHKAIREKGGAYGSAARLDPIEGVFLMSSWRDPRVAGTIADFGAAIDWFISQGPNEREWMEAKLSLLQNDDKPGTPYVEATKTIIRNISGITDEMRNKWRADIIDADLDKAKIALSKLIEGNVPSRIVSCGEHHLGEIEALGLTPVVLN